MGDQRSSCVFFQRNRTLGHCGDLFTSVRHRHLRGAAPLTVAHARPRHHSSRAERTSYGRNEETEGNEK
ncbi:hypothetical protein E2C01_047922 [Portunus trituberculatus]|uniref:Uncharacterized protein n=1 Tax=Portunus trituberculatus TaxID=210409 RepID=A0A5B7G964_PORTR|nr:hypothetical protein [Portunus trituberculatus]